MIEGEHMIPGEKPLHFYIETCECDYCLRVRWADRQRKADMEAADEYLQKNGLLKYPIGGKS